MLELNRIYNEDCLGERGMCLIPDKSIDLILADLPYGVTDSKWDSVLPLDDLWAQYKRIIKPHGAIVLTATQPFTSMLVMSNIKWFKTEWIWEKNAGSNFGAVQHVPMKEHESVLVFGNGRVTYNPIMQERADAAKKSIGKQMTYNTEPEAYSRIHGTRTVILPEKRYPRSIQRFNRERGLHPNQKPVALFEYFIRTYSDEGQTVLDNCIGSGTTGVAALQSNRNFIGFELDPEYHRIATERIANVQSALFV